jgi:lysyl-tRNA synthetase class 2
MNLKTLKKRADIIRQVDSFFYDKDYLEVDTPLLSRDLIPESCLEVFKTNRFFYEGNKRRMRSFYLVPSPEIWMKKIIAKHKVNVYQICKCFRNGESIGHLHNMEFTMLEYYTMDADYMDSLLLTEELFAFLAGKTGNPDINPPFARITVGEAFEKWAGFNLFAAAEKKGELEMMARRLGLDPMPNLSLGALYDLIFIHAVEPNLRMKKPVALINYPAFVPCLAKKSPDGRTVERWELYYNGIELANCYSEETSMRKVKEFFISEAVEREKIAYIRHRTDHNFCQIFENFPRCSGVALGLDRLIMALTGCKTIKEVLPFTNF